MSKKKNFAEYEKRQKKNFLNANGYIYMTKKREEEFYKLPSFKKGQTKEEKATNYDRRLRYNNRERARKRYTKKGGFVVTKSYEKNTNYLSRMAVYLENQMIFGDNIKELDELSQRPDIKRIEIYDGTIGKDKQLITSHPSIGMAVKFMKAHFEGEKNFQITAGTKEGKLIIIVTGFY